MKNKTYCPICGALTQYDFWYGPLGIEESVEKCDRCGFSYEFAYGGHREYVKGKEFIWSYTTPRDDIIFRRLRKAEYQARQNWRRHKKTYKWTERKC